MAFTYAGVTCNTFGAANVKPNGGAQLTNFGTGNVLVECSFVRSSKSTEAFNTLYVDTAGTIASGNP